MSVGRGTVVPFQIYGHPDFYIGSYAFTPRSKPGASQPKYEGEICYGQNLKAYAENYHQLPIRLNLTWLIESYKFLKPKQEFFIPYFEKLSGTYKLREQIIKGYSEEEIRASWKTDLEAFQKIRSKYLLYKN